MPHYTSIPIIHARPDSAPKAAKSTQHARRATCGEAKRARRVDAKNGAKKGSDGPREALTTWLEERYAQRELACGLHVTDRAHMTCLVFNYSGRHFHFIGGADGGLFLASKGFKERSARLAA